MKQRGLISLDCLLDTRIGTLKQLDPVAAVRLAADQRYMRRYHDNMDELTDGAVTREAYQEAYRKRDGDTLYHSEMTDFVYMLRKDVKAAIPEMARGVRFSELQFDINLWPYELAPSEAEIIRRAFARYIPTPAKVEVVHLSPEDLSPTYVENHYEMMAWYDHEEWLGPNQQKLLLHPLPQTVLMTPMIASSGVVPEATNDIRNPFSARAMILVQFITLQYLPVPFFCYNPFIRQELHSPPRSASAHPDDPHPEPAPQ